MASERRFFVELPRVVAIPALVALSEQDSHHLAQVLRARLGDEIVVIDRGSGRRFSAKIETVAQIVKVQLTQELKKSAEASPAETILFALSKGDTIELVIQKCTELGARNFILWQAEHSVVKFEPRDIPKKLERFAKICEGAAKQCNRSTIPNITICSNLGEALDNLSTEGIGLICSLAPEAKPLREFAPQRAVHLVVGPEGGLTQKEEELLLARGFERASLGSTVLRCETAAIASVAMVNALWDGSK